MTHNIGALVQYRYSPYPFQRHPHQRYPDIGVVTEIDEFGDHRVVWADGGIGWYSSAEIEPFKQAVIF